MSIISRAWPNAEVLEGPACDSGPCREAARQLRARREFPTVYTVMEIGPDTRKHFMGGVCRGAASVDYCIMQGLRWWKIDERVRLKRRQGPNSDNVTVTPDLTDPLMREWSGPVPQYVITEHAQPFYLPSGDDDKSISPMRCDEGWGPKA